MKTLLNKTTSVISRIALFAIGGGAMLLGALTTLTRRKPT